MGTKLVLAGAEDLSTLEILKSVGCRYILVSYYYLRSKYGLNRKNRSEARFQEFLEYLSNFEIVLLDSGAYTFFEKSDLTFDFLQEYAYEYAHFLSEFKGYISAGVELDMYEAFGDKCHSLRTEILDKTGVPIIPVFHRRGRKYTNRDRSKGRFQAQGRVQKKEIGVHNDSDLVDFCKDYRYVGISSGDFQLGMGKFLHTVKIAKKYDSVVHGFGLTRQDPLRQGMMYTADSTSWTNGARFGITYIFRNGRLNIVDYKNKVSIRKQNIKKWQRAGLNVTMEELEKDVPTAVHTVNGYEWTQYQKWLYEQCNRDYWDDPYEVNPQRDKGKPMTPPKKSRKKVLSEEEYFEEAEKEAEEQGVDSIIEDLEPQEITQEYVSTESVDEPEALPKEVVEGEIKKEVLENPIVVREEKGNVTGAFNAVELRCYDCYLAERCPRYDENSTCYFGIPPNVQNADAMSTSLMELYNLQLARVHKGALVEKLDGGVMDKNVSEEIRRTMEMAECIKKFHQEENSVTIQASGRHATKSVLEEMFGKKKSKEEE